MKNKEYYINRIKESRFFYIDAEKEPSLYLRERDRLVEYIYLYKCLESSDNYRYGLEIFETFNDCIKYYDIESGEFLNYYNKSFMLRKNKSEAKERLAELSGAVHFTSGERQSLRTIHNYLQKHPEISKEDIVKNLESFASLFSLTPDDLKEYINSYDKSFAVSGHLPLKEENELTVFDTISEKTDFTEILTDKESVVKIIEICNILYNRSRTKTQKLLKIKLSQIFLTHDKSDEYKTQLQQTSYYDEKLITDLQNSGEKITDKYIGKILGMSSSNITQIWQRYIEKIKEVYYRRNEET